MITVETRIISFPNTREGRAYAMEYKNFLDENGFSTLEVESTVTITVYGTLPIKWNEDVKDGEL